MSAESRARVSAGLRGRPVSAETRAKIGAANRGHVVTPEMREHLSAVLKGRPSSMSTKGRERLLASLRGRTRTQETIDKWRASRAGYRHSEKTRAKISKNAFIRVFTEDEKQEYRERMQGNKFALGYRHTEEEKEKITKAQTGKLCPSRGRSGVDNNFWKGGITEKNYRLRFNIGRLAEYKAWHKAVFERDNYTCQFCNEQGGDLHAHHINPFMNIIEKHQIKTVDQARQCVELWDLSNGITYCEECHCIKHFGHPSRKKNIIRLDSSQDIQTEKGVSSL